MSAFSITTMSSEAFTSNRDRYLLSFKNISKYCLQEMIWKSKDHAFYIGQYIGTFVFKGENVANAKTYVHFTISEEIDCRNSSLYQDKRITLSNVGDNMEKLRSSTCKFVKDLPTTSTTSGKIQTVNYTTDLDLDGFMEGFEDVIYSRTLEILIEIEEIKSAERKIFLPESELQKNLPELFEDTNFGDVILEVKGTQLRAYKMFLSAQSPVFAAMFKQKEMTEATKNLVEINDMEPETAKQMLEFVYIDREPSKIDEYAIDLLPVAHKYGMKRLNVICQSALIKTITEESALKIIVFADMYEAKILKQSVMEFFEQHPALILSAEFKEFNKEYHQLANTIHRKLLLKRIKL